MMLQQHYAAGAAATSFQLLFPGKGLAEMIKTGKQEMKAFLL